MIADITIVGLGMVPPDEATPQVERVLRRAREVLFVDAGPATRAWLGRRCQRVTSLFEEVYRVDSARSAAYRLMAARTVEAALDHPPVVFGMSGHPVVGALAPFLIRDLSAVMDLSVEVLPGISSVDALLAQLWLDPFVRGLQIFEASDLLLRRRRVAGDVPALIAQVGNLGRATYSLRHVERVLLQRLTEHLLVAHPPEHVVSVVFASPHPLMAAQRSDIALADLPARADLLHPGVTLFVPASRERPVADTDMLRRLSPG